MTESQRKRMRGRRWRFSGNHEGHEIEHAKRAGLVWEYLEGQRWRRMIEAETKRRQDRQRAGVGIGPWRTIEDAAGE